MIRSLSNFEHAKKKPRRWCRAGLWSLSHVDPNYRMQKIPAPPAMAGRVSITIEFRILRMG
jgi:hypothetical protein